MKILFLIALLACIVMQSLYINPSIVILGLWITVLIGLIAWFIDKYKLTRKYSKRIIPLYPEENK